MKKVHSAGRKKVNYKMYIMHLFKAFKVEIVYVVTLRKESTVIVVMLHLVYQGQKFFYPIYIII